MNLHSTKLLITAAGMCILSAAAMAKEPQSATTEVTVKSCNRNVTFDAPPKAAVSNDVNLTEMMLVLGLTDRMVGYTGISGWNKLDKEMRAGVKTLPELSAKYPSKEVLVGADADFFFAGWNYGMKVGGAVTPETLAPFGIKVYELTESCIHIGEKPKVSMDDMYNDLLNLGRIFRVEEKAEKLVAGYKAELAAFQKGLKKRSTPLRVFVYDSGDKDAPFTAGRYGMPTALIEAAGGRNILDDFEKSWAKVNWEKIIERNPEVIVIVDYGDTSAAQKRSYIKSHPALANMDAVKNDRFISLEYVEVTPGPRNIAAIRKLAEGFRGE